MLQTAQKFNLVNVYSKDWPIRDALKLRLKYTSDTEKKKKIRKTEANFKKV
jgi:small-conductance mechanosensitive channel